MYKIIKDVGASENVYLQNTTTKANLNLGVITPALARILEKNGYSVGGLYTGTTINAKDKWSLEINADTKEELRKYAQPIKRPTKAKVEKPKTKETKEIVDVLDIIYGLA